MYIHNNKSPVFLKNDPFDPDGQDWVYVCYGGYLKDGEVVEKWLRDDETIIAHALADIVGGSMITDSQYLGTVVSDEGVTHYEVYAAKIQANLSNYNTDAGRYEVLWTHRVSTSTSGAVNLGRTDIDHSGYTAVRSL